VVCASEVEAEGLGEEGSCTARSASSFSGAVGFEEVFPDEFWEASIFGREAFS
jgi:hypothetical protein